ncbi:serine hydrolase domain-containing protein [Planctobacterium marinum]|uniref:serine hydrolase domain-containing protein n=1 Tax=Planctobacterium marinum TaxID=1631968 RepID=UPI001E4634F6|nr:serine hydrolase [Planctobacterium marinum]MCC2604503.1 beta-lactamase family protein [Planctobacterium marinum]
MKKLVILVLFLVSVHFISRYSLGFSVYRLGDAIDVAASLGAKLACSAKYVSGFDDDQIIEDLASYSPATRLLALNYEVDQQRVTANLHGMSEYSAKYRPGLGCTLEIGDTAPLDELVAPELVQQSLPWPQGEQVTTLSREYQQLSENILASDNQNGLQTRALLVVKNGVVVAESYAPGIDSNTPLLGWSMGKSVTAIMLGRMANMGLLDTEAPTGFASWQGDERKQITLEQLLQMSSGLKFDETYAPGSDSTRMLFTAHSASEVALTATADKSPGGYFSYSSGTTNILMRWMRDQLGSNQALIDFFYQEIAQPLHLANTVFEVDPSGVFVGSSYIFASARDWARMGLLMLNNGKAGEQVLLSGQWVRDTQSPIKAENYQQYGYQFWLNRGGNQVRWSELPEDAYMMMGNRKQIVMIIPSQNMVIVRLGWTSGSYPTEENFARFVGL